MTPVSGVDSYVDVLPTLTLTFKPTSQDFIRFFVGREEQRPRMYDMRASRDFSYNSTYATSSSISPWGGTAGNPNLQPWIANSVDLDFEHYFAHGGGYVSVAVFEKKLLSYIYQQNTLDKLRGVPLHERHGAPYHPGLLLAVRQRPGRQRERRRGHHPGDERSPHGRCRPRLRRRR